MAQTVQLRRLAPPRSVPAVTVLVWAGALLVAYWAWFDINGGYRGFDAHAYWLTGHRADLYGLAPRQTDAFLYSPAFAQVVWPLTRFAWPVFDAAWMALEAAAFAWLLRPLGLRWGVPAFCLCVVEINVGNVYAFFALAVVLGMRWPGAWALPLLTKITPGLGPVWFAARGQWRAAAIAVGSTLAVVAVSVAVASGDWAAWFRFLADNGNGSGIRLPLQLAAAVAITVYGARTGRSWLLVPAMLVANPVVQSLHALTLFAAVPRLRAFDRQNGMPQPDQTTAPATVHAST